MKSAMITNNLGGYFLNGLNSKYNGFFVSLKNKVFKIFEVDNHDCEYDIYSIKSNDIQYIMPYRKNCLIIKNKKNKNIGFNFDIRESYDSRNFGKNYLITRESGMIVIEFTKKTDSREDKTKDEKEYQIYVAIKAEGYEMPNNWFERHYSYDQRRNSYPFSKYLYNCLNVEGKEIVIAVSHSKDEAMSQCADVFVMIKKYITERKRKIVKVKKEELTIAVNSLVGLITDTGIYAGLPWFFQYWSRDELICLKALMLLKDYRGVKEILFRWLSIIGEDGRLPNQYPEHQTGSADGIGWLFKRLYDFTLMLNKEKNLEKYFSKKDKKFILKKLEATLEALKEHHIQDGLMFNDGKETWMDTKVGSSDRRGKRIEIQCMYLNLYKLMYFLEGDAKYKQKENEIKKKVRDFFYKEEMLADGLDDFTIRPNIFLAYYIYPDLLAKDEWSKVFEKALPRLWLNWGGLSTIDKDDPLYKTEHTGETVDSYHHGDSWFWVNNYAAIALREVDSEKFKDYITKIKEASLHDLNNGLQGHCSEVSSASSLKAEGCLCQAWSAASFIELFWD